MNYNRVYIAVFISVIAHIIACAIFLSKDNPLPYINNGIQAFDRPRISLNISKMKPIKRIEPKIEEIKPADVITPIEQKKEEVIEVADDKKIQEHIPIVENATFKGRRNPPDYPQRALMLKQEGVVLLKALIGKSGDINDIQIITSSGYAILDKSAIKAVRTWQFEPSYIDGKASISWVKVPVEFVIK